MLGMEIIFLLITIYFNNYKYAIEQTTPTSNIHIVTRFTQHLSEYRQTSDINSLHTTDNINTLIGTYKNKILHKTDH